MFSALYSCWEPCNQEGALKPALLIPPKALPCHFEALVYPPLVVCVLTCVVYGHTQAVMCVLKVAVHRFGLLWVGSYGRVRLSQDSR